MTEGPSHPVCESDPVCADKSAPTAADAAVLQLAEAVSLKQSAEPGSALPPHVRDGALFVLTDAARDLAAIKNVHPDPGQDAEIAAAALAALDTATVHALLQCENGAVARAAATLNFLLDVHWACQAILVLRGADGFDQLNPEQTLADAHAWIMAQRIANDTGDTRMRWPDLGEMIVGHLKARSSGPVAVQFLGNIRAAYALDPSLLRSHVPAAARTKRPACAALPTGPITQEDADRARTKPIVRQPDGFMPEPLLIRCPALAPLTRASMPDGRRVQTRADGSVVTSYFKNGVYHRDPKEGPAWHCIGPSGERSEYFLDGCLHRDPTAGPAQVEFNAEGACMLEAYFEHGVLHRHPKHGPALYQHDLYGERWEYLVRGQYHRDPADGPAVARRRLEGINEEEYYWHGSWHRAVRQGPAVRHVDQKTGVILKECYFVKGQPHRIGAPAIVGRTPDGQLAFETWCKNGSQYRNPDEGPSHTSIDPVTGRRSEEYSREVRLLDDGATVDA
ncbi:MAG: hypothetical protein WDO17_15420 [Alphaproteobacteria bacterium]